MWKKLLKILKTDNFLLYFGRIIFNFFIMKSSTKFLLLGIFVVIVFGLLYWNFQKKSGEEGKDTTTTEDKATSDKDADDDKTESDDSDDAEELSADVDSMTMGAKLKAIERVMRRQPYDEMTDEEKTEEKAEVEKMMGLEDTKVLWTAEFIDKAYQGAGLVKLIEEGGKRYLVFNEDFKTEPGPNLHVFLSGTASPENSSELDAVGDYDAGVLKSTSGTQMYEVPKSLDFDAKSVVVYCVPFKVVFALANVEVKP